MELLLDTKRLMPTYSLGAKEADHNKLIALRC